MSSTISQISMLTFKVEKDGKKFHAYCQELKGCHTFGNTKAEAIKNLKNAVSLYIEDEVESQTISPLIKRKQHVKI